MKVFTIGFTQTSAERFFGRLQAAGVARVVDVRLNNVSQLSGFAKRDDLRYFLGAIGSIPYEHRPELAPTAALLEGYKKRRVSWHEYERAFTALIAERQIERTLARDVLDGACLLCSELQPHHCHRRVVAEYLQGHWGDLEIIHL